MKGVIGAVNRKSAFAAKRVRHGNLAKKKKLLPRLLSVSPAVAATRRPFCSRVLANAATILVL
jgi:hypothetical protein